MQRISDGQTESNSATGPQVKNQLRKLIEITRCDPDIPKSLPNAMESLLMAMEHDDATLMRSHVETALQESISSLDEGIQKRLGWPEKVRSVCQEIWELMKENPFEDFDDVGTKISSCFDEMIRPLSNILEGPAKMLQEHGYHLANVKQLENDIVELRQMKKNFVDSWPWSNRELPPVDVEMLHASMEAIKIGSRGERIEDLIARLGGKIQETK